MQLSSHFSLAELTHSNTAVARRIPNLPGPAELPRLQALCQSVLEPLREALGRPLKVTSGYRSPALNAVIPGSSPTSQHSQGEAADLQCPGMNTATLFKTLIRLGLPFDQIIYEAKNASSIWVHVSHRAGGNRGQMLIANFLPNGKVSYSAVTRDQALAIPEGTRSLAPEPELSYEETADEPPQRAPRKTAVARAARAATMSPRKAPAKAAPANKPSAKASPARKVAAKKAPASTRAPAKSATESAAKPAAKSVAKTAAKPGDRKPAVKSNPSPATKTAATRKTATPKAPAKKASSPKAAATKTTAKAAAAKKAPARKIAAS